MPGIDFLVYSRAAGAEPDQMLTEEHWSYMDRFAQGMTARGPTLAADRETWTGSLHIVDLPSAEAARESVEGEPYHRAGLFEGHVVRRFENRLGRTMWEFPGDPVAPRFLVFADLDADGDERAAAGRRAAFAALPRERLIVHGELSTPDAAAPGGVVLVLQAPAREAVGALLEDVDLEIHDWEPGGRR